MVRVFLAQFTRPDLWIGPAIGLKSNVWLRKKKRGERFLCMSCFSWKLWRRSFLLYLLGIFRYTYVEIIEGTLKKPFAFIDASSSTYLVFLCAYRRSDVSRCYKEGSLPDNGYEWVKVPQLLLSRACFLGLYKKHHGLLQSFPISLQRPIRE